MGICPLPGSRTSGQEIALLTAQLREAKEELAEYRLRDTVADAPLDDMTVKVEGVRRWFGLTRNQSYMLVHLIERAPNVVTDDRIMVGRPSIHPGASEDPADSRNNSAVMLSRVRRKLADQGFPGLIENSHGLGHFISRTNAEVIRGHVLKAVAAMAV